MEAARVTCQQQSVYSNAEGRFTIAGVDNAMCAARVEKTGFEPRTADLAAASEAKITLSIAGPVETVVVSANRTETTPEQAVVSANVITEQQLDSAAIPDALRRAARNSRPARLTRTVRLERWPKSSRAAPIIPARWCCSTASL